MDRLAKIKVTCSSARVREKLDILREKHDQAVVDMQKTVSEVYQVVTEKEAQVANLAEKCADAAHICTEICTQQNESATKELNQIKVNLNTGFAITFDNVDGKLERRHISKDNQNFDFHWVNHKIVKNRILQGMSLQFQISQFYPLYRTSRDSGRTILY